MKTTLLTAAAAVALLAGGSAFAQTTAAPAAPKPTEQPAAPATATPAPAPAATPATPSAATPAPATPGAAAPAGPIVAQGDIIDTLKASGKFTILIRALDETNLTNVIKTNKNLTLLAPTDAAFAALPAGELKRLESTPAELQKLLTYHLINAPIDSTKVKERAGNVATVAGPNITLDNSGAAFTAGPATVTQADVKTTNGLIHVIDKVLTPGGTPVAANMTTDTPATGVPEGRVFRASWQPAPTEPSSDAAMPMTEPSADQATPDDTATEPAADAPADAAAPAPAMAPADTAATPPTTTAQATQVTNGPVLDTAENRAKYPPQSRAGKRTPAKGN